MKPIKFLLALFATFIFADVASQALPFSTGQIALAIGATSVLMPKMSNVLMVSYNTTTDVAAIAKFAGPYSRQILGQILNGMDIMSDLKVDRAVSRKGKLLPKLTIAAGIQPLDPNKEKNNRNERTVSGRKLMVYDVMKLMRWVPDEWRESYASDMLEPGAKQVPFAQYVIQKELEKLASEVNDNFYTANYAGDAANWASGSTYTASNGTVVFFETDRNYYKVIQNTSAGESPATHPAKWQLVNAQVGWDGIGTLIADEIAASAITPVTTGALSDTNAVTKVESMFDSLTDPQKSAGGLVHMSHTIFNKYLRHFRSLYGYTQGPDAGSNEMYVYGNRQWRIRPATWMGSSGRVIFNLKGENLVVGTNLALNPGITNTVAFIHGLDGVAKFLMGSQIADLEQLIVNDQA